ncbi:MAG: MBL fold metallo-hydrolase [Bacteroidota bacterium]
MVYKILLFIIMSCNACSSNKSALNRVSNSQLPIVKQGWKGNYKIDNRFSQDSMPASPPFWEVIQWKLSKNPQSHEKKQENHTLHVTGLSQIQYTQSDGIAWFGHSTCIITIGGVCLITDPVLGNIPFAQRKVGTPCIADSLTNLDYILLSHDHRDHLDKKSIDALCSHNPPIELLAPLNTSSLFTAKKYNNLHIQEAGWYQEYNIDEDIRIFFVPSKHWGRRRLFDFNTRLWGSFVIQGEDITIFFAGDTGYDAFFTEVYDMFGPVDYCILPIGAYAPQNLMSESHMTPEEAVRAMQDLHAQYIVPIHYGTFDLSDEPMGEPIQRLKSSLQKDSLHTQLIELHIGEWYSF